MSQSLHDLIISGEHDHGWWCNPQHPGCHTTSESGHTLLFVDWFSCIPCSRVLCAIVYITFSLHLQSCLDNILQGGKKKRPKFIRQNRNQQDLSKDFFLLPVQDLKAFVNFSEDYTEYYEDTRIHNCKI